MTKDIVGCPVEQAKAINIDEGLWEEMEQLAKENPAGSYPSNIWGEKEEFILVKYFAKATTPAILKMLEMVNPNTTWGGAQVRSKARRMGLKKDIQR